MLEIILIYLLFCLFDYFRNISYLYECKSLIKKIKSNRDNIEMLSEYKNQIKVLLSRAGVSDEYYLKEYSTDFERVMQNSTVLTAFPYFPVEDNVLNMLRNAKGFYKRLALRNLNPIFIIERFFKFPSHILEQLNLNTSSKINGILNILWTVIFWLFTPFLEGIRTNLLEFLSNINL